MACNKLSLLVFSILIVTVSSRSPFFSSSSPSISSRQQNFPANVIPTTNILLKSSDGVFFEVNDTVISVSETIKHVLEMWGANDAVLLPKEVNGRIFSKIGVFLPDVNGRILSKVIEYCNKHFEEDRSPNSEDLKKFDSEFMRVDKETLFSLVRASNYLKIQRLEYLTSRTIVKMVMGKTQVQTRKFFNISDDWEEPCGQGLDCK